MVSNYVSRSKPYSLIELGCLGNSPGGQWNNASNTAHMQRIIGPRNVTLAG